MSLNPAHQIFQIYFSLTVSILVVHIKTICLCLSAYLFHFSYLSDFFAISQQVFVFLHPLANLPKSQLEHNDQKALMGPIL